MPKSKRVLVENWWYRPGSLEEGRKSRWLLWEKKVSILMTVTFGTGGAKLRGVA
jgi:hypothetical protein